MQNRMKNGHLFRKKVKLRLKEEKLIFKCIVNILITVEKHETNFTLLYFHSALHKSHYFVHKKRDKFILANSKHTNVIYFKLRG